MSFSLPLLFFEAYYRITNPIYNAGNNIDYRDTDTPFYAYKLNSILNQDSNYVSVLILILLLYCIFLSKFYKNGLTLFKIIFSILLIITISRAAILVLILTVFYLSVRHLLKFRIIKIILLLIVILLIYNFVQFAINDLSTQIKIASIFKSYSQVIEANAITKLIGVGIGNSAAILGGVSAHNIIEALILEQGLLGFMLFIFVQIKIDQLSNGTTRIIMIPFLFLSMSFFVYAITYYYAILALTCLIYYKKNHFEKV